MKKKMSMLMAGALLCSLIPYSALSASAIEAVTMQERSQIVNAEAESVFPDPEERYTIVEEDGFEFRIYKDYAVLSECKDTELTEAAIPELVNDLPVVGSVGEPFRFCHKLTSIALPDCFEHFSWFDLVNNTVSVDGSSDEMMPTISEVYVTENNPYYTFSDGILYTKDMKTLIGCPPAKEIKELNIPEQTDTISDYAFFACSALETAVIPENIKHINCNAFTACMNLKKAEFPESITALSGDMFYLCTSLSEVVFKGELKKIGYGAFNTCESLKDFVIPSTVEVIGSQAFEGSGCIENVDGLHYVNDWLVGSDKDITSAVVREGTVGIAEMAMFIRSDVKLADIPESVKYFGAAFFGGTSSDDKPGVMYYRASYVPEKGLTSNKLCSDIYFYDPHCEFFDSEKTISAVYKCNAFSDETEGSMKTEGDVVIHGYAGTDAQVYAEKYNRKFVEIKPDGDLNGDGACTVSDMIIFQKWLLNGEDAELKNWKAADLCDDGVLNIYDLCLMRASIIQETEKPEDVPAEEESEKPVTDTETEKEAETPVTDSETEEESDKPGTDAETEEKPAEEPFIIEVIDVIS